MAVPAAMANVVPAPVSTVAPTTAGPNATSAIGSTSAAAGSPTTGQTKEAGSEDIDDGTSSEVSSEERSSEDNTIGSEDTDREDPYDGNIDNKDPDDSEYPSDGEAGGRDYDHEQNPLSNNTQNEHDHHHNRNVGGHDHLNDNQPKESKHSYTQGSLTVGVELNAGSIQTNQSCVRAHLNPSPLEMDADYYQYLEGEDADQFDSDFKDDSTNISTNSSSEPDLLGGKARARYLTPSPPNIPHFVDHGRSNSLHYKIQENNGFTNLFRHG